METEESQAVIPGNITTEVIRIDPSKIRLLEVNARFMRQETFDQLKDNIGQDGELTQIPFGWQIHEDETQEPLFEDDEPVYGVLSGNHRVKAAVAAKLETILFQVTRDYLSPDQRKAIQLSHNELIGEDDPTTLRTVYESIGDVELRLYSGLDDNKLNLMDSVETMAISEANLTFQKISMMFLPDELDGVLAAWDAAQESIAGSSDVFLVRTQEYDKFLDSLAIVSDTFSVRNTATALAVVLEVFSRHLEDLNEDWFEQKEMPGNRVSLATVVGTDLIPADIAGKIKRLIDKKISEGTVTQDNPWAALDQLLSGHED